MHNFPTDSEKQLIERLKKTSFYQACQNAFRNGTGLPLIIQSAYEPDFNPCYASKNQNQFCQKINSRVGAFQHCVREQEELFFHAEKKACSHTCFAGLQETAVPLRLGHRTIGFLRTGQVFTEQVSAEHSKAALAALVVAGCSASDLKESMSRFQKTTIYDQERYSSSVTLLSIISLQLTEFLNRLLLEAREDEPEVVCKAKSIISDNLDKRITLEDVAQGVDLSVFYFCKVFKQSTGMTFTEYVNRLRVERAKRELKGSEKAITEIAYAIGFQSLSHFNRCFLKFVGESPRQFRNESHTTSFERLVS